MTAGRDRAGGSRADALRDEPLKTKSLRADVVVVGAGPAGCVMARRLADAGADVLLLEAGDHLASPRAGLLDVGSGSRVVRRHRARSGERFWELPRGHTLGGSGAVNGGYCSPARPADLAMWGEEWPRRYAVGLARASERLRPRLEPMGSVAARVAAAFPERVSAITQARRGAQRVTAFDAWDPVGAGVRVRSGASVARVRWADDLVGGRCDGVVLAGDDDDNGIEISATQVILCAGTIGSASILRASGLGESTGHPVGHRVQEHPELLLEVPADWAPAAGPVPEALPALLSHVVRLEFTDHEVEVRPYSLPLHRFIPGLDPEPLRIGVALMNPVGVGRIDSDGTVWLPEDPGDAEVLSAVAGLVADRLESGVRESGVHGSGEPGSDVLGPSGRVLTPSTSQHLSGSARIGEVVDEQGRVLGVEGLRVADASVLPELPRCGPYYTVLAVAEALAADMIAARPW